MKEWRKNRDGGTALTRRRGRKVTIGLTNKEDGKQ
jgi:hypothetical protein